MSYGGWTHGSRTFLGRVVEVRQVRYASRGLPAGRTGRYHARLKLGEGAYAATDESFETQESAERYLLDRLAELCDDAVREARAREADDGPTPLDGNSA